MALPKYYSLGNSKGRNIIKKSIDSALNPYANFRFRLGLTIKQLSLHLGISPFCYRLYERGVAVPDPPIAKLFQHRLAMLGLHVTMDDLYQHVKVPCRQVATCSPLTRKGSVPQAPEEWPSVVTYTVINDSIAET